MSKYSPKAILEKSPNTISLAIFAVVNFALVVGGYHPDPVEMGLGETALLAVLNLFVVQPNTQTNEVVNAQVSQVAAETEKNITQYLAQQVPPVDPAAVAAVAQADAADQAVDGVVEPPADD